MRQMIGHVLAETAEMWNPIRGAERWVRAAEHVLASHEGKKPADVQQAFVRVLRSIGVTKRHCGVLEDALTHFLKVTRSYRTGLLHCS